MHNCFEVIRGFNYVASHKERFDNSKDLLGPNVIDNVERGLKYSFRRVMGSCDANKNLQKLS